MGRNTILTLLHIGIEYTRWIVVLPSQSTTRSIGGSGFIVLLVALAPQMVKCMCIHSIPVQQTTVRLNFCMR